MIVYRDRDCMIVMIVVTGLKGDGPRKWALECGAAD